MATLTQLRKRANELKFAIAQYELTSNSPFTHLYKEYNEVCYELANRERKLADKKQAKAIKASVCHAEDTVVVTAGEVTVYAPAPTAWTVYVDGISTITFNDEALAVRRCADYQSMQMNAIVIAN